MTDVSARTPNEKDPRFVMSLLMNNVTVLINFKYQTTEIILINNFNKELFNIGMYI